jgi:glucosamine kinase
MSMDKPIFIGIDGGGTSCNAKLFDSNKNVLAEVQVGPANAFVNSQQTQHSIVTAAQMCLTQAGLVGKTLADIFVGAGLAGMGLPSAQQAMSDWVHPFAGFAVTTDVHITALAANAGEDCGLVVVGTGSCGAKLSHGQLMQYGGYGFFLGDDASGSWLGLQALRHTLQALDGIVETSLLSDEVVLHLGHADIVSIINDFHKLGPKEFGQFSPIVFRCAYADDTTAIEIIKQGARYLHKLIQRVSDNYSHPVFYHGNVMTHYIPYLQLTAKKILTHQTIVPELGAVTFLEKQLQAQGSL